MRFYLVDISCRNNNIKIFISSINTCVEVKIKQFKIDCIKGYIYLMLECYKCFVI